MLNIEFGLWSCDCLNIDLICTYIYQRCDTWPFEHSFSMYAQCHICFHNVSITQTKHNRNNNSKLLYIKLHYFKNHFRWKTNQLMITYHNLTFLTWVAGHGEQLTSKDSWWETALDRSIVGTSVFDIFSTNYKPDIFNMIKYLLAHNVYNTWSVFQYKAYRSARNFSASN